MEREKITSLVIRKNENKKFALYFHRTILMLSSVPCIIYINILYTYIYGIVTLKE